jgi:CxxC motif-containing protein (DUF1111 family)
MFVGDAELTGASIHCRNFCSSCAQPCTLYPEEAQQPVQASVSHVSQSVAFPARRELWRNHPVQPSRR